MSRDEGYQDPRAVAALVAAIGEQAVGVERRVTFMEVCGTHTHAVAAAGLRRLLPESVRLVSGPGCPVCVTPVDYLDRAVALAGLPDVTVCTFGDLMRVPSSTTTLERARAEGGSVEVVYSPRDALQLAKREPGRRVVFLAVGFETTVPTIAGALAEADRVTNFLLLAGNKVIPPAMRILAADERIAVDGFLLPGHVSVVTGADAFRFLADDLGVRGAVVGFTATDILRGVLELLEQVVRGEVRVVNLYARAVTAGGNRVARELVERFFVPVDSVWRGFGRVPGSGLALGEEWSGRDASRIPVDLPAPREPAGCRCGDVLRGLADPPECGLFASECTPESPVGACMVSSEGTCAAWHRHERLAAS